MKTAEPNECQSQLQDLRSQARSEHQRLVFWALIAILILTALLRSIHLHTLFPILVDESIYLRWAEIIDHQGQWFISLLDAKQPLSYWVYAIIRKCFPGGDPLLEARTVSVVAGIVTTFLLFRLGCRLGGTRAGLICSFLYSILPFGVLYDRLAYTDSLVNMFGAAITLASIWCFSSDAKGRLRALLPAILLGLAIFTKTTSLLFLLVPVTAALMWGRRPLRDAASPLAVIYCVAFLFPAFSYFMVPKAPTFEVNHLLLHHTSFFIAPEDLWSQPLLNVAPNGAIVSAYLASYLTLPVAASAMIAILYLLRKKDIAAYLAVPLFIAPVSFELIFLQFTQSRYFFPLAWPFLMFIALALCHVGWLRSRIWLTLATCVISVPMIVASARLLRYPEAQLQEDDAAEFLGSGPFSGFGIDQAVNYLRAAAAREPIIILTDPIWGPPADAIYPYMNQWHGTRVYDAWWMQLPGNHPILPLQATEIMKSQYERVAAGVVDFPSLANVFYVTDTNYYKPLEVFKREPQAKLLARFVKRNGTDSIDVYRLR